MNPRQAAEYRNEIARAKLASVVVGNREARAAEKARPKRTYKRRPRALPPPLPPLSARVQPPATAAEAELAARFLPHICTESAVNREAHALGVARMLLNAGVRR